MDTKIPTTIEELTNELNNILSILLSNGNSFGNNNTVKITCQEEDVYNNMRNIRIQKGFKEKALKVMLSNDFTGSDTIWIHPITNQLIYKDVCYESYERFLESHSDRDFLLKLREYVTHLQLI